MVVLVHEYFGFYFIRCLSLELIKKNFTYTRKIN